MSLDIDLKCPHCEQSAFSCNVTHNLIDMAKAAGYYEKIWRADENEDGSFKELLAEDFLPDVKDCLATLLADRIRYKTFDPSNGWGSYEGFCKWLQRLAVACIEHPKLQVRCSR